MAEHFNVVEQFGTDVFNEETMKQRLPKNIFKTLRPLPRARSLTAALLMLLQAQ